MAWVKRWCGLYAQRDVRYTRYIAQRVHNNIAYPIGLYTSPFMPHSHHCLYSDVTSAEIRVGIQAELSPQFKEESDQPLQAYLSAFSLFPINVGFAGLVSTASFDVFTDLNYDVFFRLFN